MGRHLADKREPSDGGRVKQFLRLAQSDNSAFWDQFRRRPQEMGQGNRRVTEFARIARGHQT